MATQLHDKIHGRKLDYLGAATTPKVTPQSEPIFGEDQTENSAGGYVYAVDKWTRLKRFLILGSEGGSYYATERKLTLENATVLLECLHADGERTVKEIVAVSIEGRAPKNDVALYALAVAASKGDEKTRRQALDSLPLVARTFTHLAQFVGYARLFRGWGRGLRRGVALWFLRKPVKDVVYQILKYRNREGYTPRDLLRVAHPKTKDPVRNSVFNAIVKEAEDLPIGLLRNEDTRLWEGYSALSYLAQGITGEGQPLSEETLKQELPIATALVKNYRLTREMVPQKYLKEPLIWEALLRDMPLTAMIRNLATMTRVGLLDPMSDATATVVERLRDTARLQKARVHPLSVLFGLRTYASGQGFRGKGTWTPVQQVVDALDDAFYLSFKNVEPTGKRILLALDVSGSMASGGVAGSNITPREASAALALVTAATEDKWQAVGFAANSGRGYRYYGHNNGKLGQPGYELYASGLCNLPISPRQRLEDAIKVVSGLPFGRTDCALPMLHAIEENLLVDAFVIYTDSETWAGDIHPTQALDAYRKHSGIDAKLVVVGMVANKFSIASPDDPGMLDVVGFDTSTPQLISDFIAGRI